MLGNHQRFEATGQDFTCPSLNTSPNRTVNYFIGWDDNVPNTAYSPSLLPYI